MCLVFENRGIEGLSKGISHLEAPEDGKRAMLRIGFADGTDRVDGIGGVPC
jgi:hypothetical protein